MKRIGILLLVVGLAAAVALVAEFGAGAVEQAIAGMGMPGFLVFCLAHAPVVALLGLGWRVCLPRDGGASLAAIVWARVLRDAGAEVLPFSELGGFVIGARAAMLGGLAGAEAAASTIVDLTTEAAAQLGFIALGLLALQDIRPGAAVIRPALLGLVAIIGAAAGLAVWLRRSGGLDRLLRARAAPWLAGFGDLDRGLAAFRAMTGRPRALAASFAVHLAAWLGVAFEAWLGLRLIGAPISWQGAIALESLLFAARSLAFFAPNAWGVQEGAYALLAPLVGISPADALALSLVKRARDLVVGAPALLIWQRAEAARAWRKRSDPAN
jgi:putative membrane protein